MPNDNSAPYYKVNVFHKLPLFKYKCWSLKLVVVLMHGWQITQKAKLVAKKWHIKAKQTEIKQEKGHTFTQYFLLHNHYFDKQTDRKVKTERPKIMQA